MPDDTANETDTDHPDESIDTVYEVKADVRGLTFHLDRERLAATDGDLHGLLASILTECDAIRHEGTVTIDESYEIERY